jgi:hypothetical protein
MLNKRYLYCLLSVIFFPLLEALAQESPNKIVTQIDSSSILIGNRTDFRLVVTTPKQANVYLPVIKDTLTSHIEVIGKLKIDSVVQNDGLIQRTYHYTLTSFDSGLQHIPAIQILVKNNQRVDTLLSEALFLQVDLVQADTTKGIADIKPPVKAPITFTEAMPYIGAGLLGVLVFLLAFWIYRRWKQHKPLLPMLRKVEPPHVVALRELNKLKDEKLWQQGNSKLYYSRLTDILRSYLEGRFFIQAMEKTTSEIMHSISQLSDKEIIPMIELQQILATADLAKFAKVVPNDVENKQCMDYAFVIVERTTPVVVDNEDVNDKNK